MEESYAETDVATWMKKLIDDEISRLRSHKVIALPLPVKNTGIVRRDGKIINRVEIDSGFAFEKVQQIMVSEPVDCPMKGGYNYVHLLLWTDPQKPMPFILPYMFQKDPKNKLNEWALINSSLMEARHTIRAFRNM